MYPISTLKRWVISKYLACKSVPTWGEKMRAVNKRSQTTMSIISRYLQYIHTPNFQNIPAQMDIHDFLPPKCKTISAQWKIFLKYHRNREPMICKW
jgi:hypothetical protein